MRTSTIAATLFAASASPAFGAPTPRWVPEARAGAAASLRTGANIGTVSDAFFDVFDTFFASEEASGVQARARVAATTSLPKSLQTGANVGALSDAFFDAFDFFSPEEEIQARRVATTASLPKSVQTGANVGTLSDAFFDAFDFFSPEEEIQARRVAATASLPKSLQTGANVGTLSDAFFDAFDFFSSEEELQARSRVAAVPQLAAAISKRLETEGSIGALKKIFGERDFSPETLRILLSGAPIAALD